MLLYLNRTYFTDATNGRLYHEGGFCCYTIELPWRDNMKQVSCIPEGKYELRKRYSRKFGWHIEIVGVMHRSLILIHSANNALKELRGCIGTVTQLLGSGLGTESRVAFKQLTDLVYPILERNERVYLIIQSKN